MNRHVSHLVAGHAVLHVRRTGGGLAIIAEGGRGEEEIHTSEVGSFGSVGDLGGRGPNRWVTALSRTLVGGLL